jgi:hypothetical protein
MNAIIALVRANQFLALLVVLQFVTTMATAQELAVDWNETQSGIVGPISGVRNNMTIDWATGAQYVLDKAGDPSGAWTLIKLDRYGSFKWSFTPFDRFVSPVSLLYRDGAVYFLVQDDNSMMVIKVLDLGTSASLAPGDPTPITPSNGSCTVTAMLTDPVGDGVIVTARFAHDNPGVRGFYNIMETRRVSAAGVVTEFDDLDLGTTGYLPFTSAKALCSDAAGNVYATGASDAVVPGTTTEFYVYPSRLFVVKFDPAGHIAWTHYLSATGFAHQGYDIEVDATGVYVLGQKEPEHAGPGIPPGFSGTTTLSKFDLVDGHQIRTVDIPSRIREFTPGSSVQRDVLVLDGAAGQIYVAYDEIEASTVGLDQYNTALNLQWSKTVSIGETTTLSGLAMTTEHTINVSTNGGSGVSAIHAFGSTSRFIDDLYLPGVAIDQILPDAFGGVHVSSDDNLDHISTRVYLTPRYPIIPEYVGRLEDFKFELFEEIHPHWGKLLVDWSCLSPDCYGSDFVATLMADGKNIWQSSIVKPVTLALPASKISPAFFLQMKSGNTYQDIFRVSENVVTQGVKSISVSSNAGAQTLSVSIDTDDGTETPVTLLILNKDGKTLGEQKLIAPFTKTFGDKFNEPVATISLSGEATPFTVSEYPNPSNGEFKLTLSNQVKFPASLVIYDSQGMKAHSQTLTNLNENVAVANPRPGLYLLKVITKSGSVNKTIQVK